MKRRPPRSTRTDTLFPYTTLFRSPARDERPCTRRSFISILIEISIELAYRRFMTSPTQSGIRMPQGDQIWAVDALQALGHETRLSVFRMLVKAGPDGLMAGAIAQGCESGAASCREGVCRFGLIAVVGG